MSTVIAKNVQVGTSGTAAQNFTLYQPASPDGTVRLANGNSGTTTDLVTVNSSGNVGIGTTSPTNRLQVAVGGADVARFTNTQSNGGDWQFKIGGGGFEDRKFMFTDKYGGADNVRWAIDSSGQRSTNIVSTVGTSYSTLYPAYDCRAWVNFNGTGTVAIRASGNVSSITDNGTGDYTVNFTTAMPDENYAWHNSFIGSYQRGIVNGFSWSQTTSSIRFNIRDTTNGAAADEPWINISVFR
jgi:hypothetical protein